MAKKLTVQKTFDLEAAGAAAKVTVSFEKEQPFEASDFDVVEEALLKLAERVETRAFEQRPMAKEYWSANKPDGEDAKALGLKRVYSGPIGAGREG